MKILTIIISFLILGAFFAAPVILLICLNKRNVKYMLVSYFGLTIVVTVFIMALFGFWTHYSDIFLLHHYGFDFDAMTEEARYENVAIEHFEQVKNMEHSISGIGWPLATIFGYAVFSPFILIVYMIDLSVKKFKK